MTAPELAAGRFSAACLLGLGLGAWYGFLRPLRPKWTVLADGLFLLGLYWAWLYLGFALCGGDLRLGYTLGLGVGAVCWDHTAGRLLRPVFSGFWKAAAKTGRFFLFPGKYFLKKVKILFALAEKWVTIKWSYRRQKRRLSGGVSRGRTKKSLPQSKIRRSAQHSAAEDHRDSGYLVFYGGAAGFELGQEQYPDQDSRHAVPGRGAGI